MVAACAVADAPLVDGLMSVVDCNLGAVVQAGYGVLSDPGGTIGLALGVALTLFVALYGYRLLLGRASLNLAEAVSAALKIGIVLILAGSWATYQTLVYDVLNAGPVQLAGTLLAALHSGDAVAGGNPLDQLQDAFDQLQASAGYYAARAGGASPLTGGIAFGAMATNGASMLLLLSTVGLMLAARVVLALLLALAPVVAGLLLFDATRGMVEGWIRAMVALALVPLLVMVLLAVELAAIAPGLATLAENRAAGVYELDAVMSVSVLVLVFAGVIGMAVLSGVMIARGIRLPRRSDRAHSGASPAPGLNGSGNSGWQPQSHLARVVSAADAAAQRAAVTEGNGRDGRLRIATLAQAYRMTGDSALFTARRGLGDARGNRPRRMTDGMRRDR